MTDTCVCGGSRARPNPDCERCGLIARIAELETALVTIKRWIDARQFDGEACRQWVIAHVGQKKAR
jgi:hypothetical protein